MNSRPMNHQCKTIKKRCERCEMFFEIQNIKQSRARELLIIYTPCSHCGHVVDVKYPKNDTQGNCAVCKVTFQVLKHHALGMCVRCHRAHLRDKNKGF